VFDRNNLLYMSVGDRGLPENAQNRNNHLGKVLRFNDDGTVPASNPLVGVPNTQPQIFTWGNRNIQGMAMNPSSGLIYAHEHGPRGGDELNLIKANTNYGWPEVTFGTNYNGTPITADTTRVGMESPLTYWVPSIAPSGMTFITNGQPNNEADILIGALAGTHLHWLKLRDNKKIASTRSMNGYARFRDVRQAPDGKIYAMTESPNRFILLR
jgi:glucose/arabinose dehydrogenase